MTDLERHALLGDKEAQKECTEKGIVLPCPFCGGKNIEMGAFSISPDCFIACKCGAEITLEVPFNGMSVPEHDRVCHDELVKAWNRRANHG